MSARRKLLLVDDDEAVIEYLSVKLGGEFELVTTGSAQEALELARSARPDLVLCDIDLPELDGGDISAALFADPATHDVPLLFLTALVSPRDLAAQGNQLAGRAAVSKQSSIEEISARIRTVLEAAG
jgi:putative two-component system response regulator